MTPSQLPAAAEPTRFSRRQVAADGQTAAQLRDEFGGWLRRSTDLGEVGLCDVVLAVNEALANAAEFAYPQNPGAGTVDLEAVLDGTTLAVTIADHGTWRPSDPAGRQRCRGRGIPLMRSLADDLVIATSAVGTTVCLRFDDVHSPHPAGVMV